MSSLRENVLARLKGESSSRGTRSSRLLRLVVNVPSNSTCELLNVPKFWMNFSTIFQTQDKLLRWNVWARCRNWTLQAPFPSPHLLPKNLPKNSGQAVQSTTELSVDVCSLFLFNFSQIWTRFVNLKNFFVTCLLRESDIALKRKTCT